MSYSVIQSGGGTGGVITNTFSAATTAGHTLVLTCVSNSAVGTATATDGTHTYTLTEIAYTSGHNGDYSGIWALPNCPAGLTSATINGAYSCGYLEVSGIDIYSPVHGVTETGNSTGTTSMTCTNPGTSSTFTVFAYGYDVANGGTPVSDGTTGAKIMSQYGQFGYITSGANTSGTIASGTYDVCAVAFNPTGTGSGTPFAGPQYVAQRAAAAFTTAATEFNLSPSSVTGTGTTLILGISMVSGNWLSGIRDTQGNVWHVDLETGTGTAADVAQAHCFLDSPLTTSDVITVDVHASTTAAINVVEFGGIARGATQYAAAYTSNSSASAASLALTTSAPISSSPYALQVTAVAATAATTWTAPAGYYQLPTGLANNYLDMAFTVGPIGSYAHYNSGTWTQSGTTAMAATAVVYQSQQAYTGSAWARRSAAVGVYRGPLGVMKQNGVAGSTGDGIAAYSTWLGRPVKYVLDYLLSSPTSTTQFTAGHLTANNSQNTDSGSLVTSWGGHLGTGQVLMLGVPACIGRTAGAGATTWAQEASGSSDTYWTSLGNALISAGLGNSVLRIGREFNYSGYNWSPSTTGDTIANYVAGYQHIVTLLRGLTGANFKFMWNPALTSGTMAGQTGSNAETQNWFPGSSYVDYIGLDSYDWQSYTAQTGPYLTPALGAQEYSFASLETAQDGIANWLSFANAEGIPLCWPEWGPNLWLSGGSYYGGGDNPWYITQMADLHATAFMGALWEDNGMGLFDTDSYAGRTSGVPVPTQARITFLELLGPNIPGTPLGPARPGLFVPGDASPDYVPLVSTSATVSGAVAQVSLSGTTTAAVPHTAAGTVAQASVSGTTTPAVSGTGIVAGPAAQASVSGRTGGVGTTIAAAPAQVALSGTTTAGIPHTVIGAVALVSGSGTTTAAISGTANVAGAVAQVSLAGTGAVSTSATGTVPAVVVSGTTTAAVNISGGATVAGAAAQVSVAGRGGVSANPGPGSGAVSVSASGAAGSALAGSAAQVSASGTTSASLSGSGIVTGLAGQVTAHATGSLVVSSVIAPSAGAVSVISPAGAVIGSGAATVLGAAGVVSVSGTGGASTTTAAAAPAQVGVTSTGRMTAGPMLGTAGHVAVAAPAGTVAGTALVSASPGLVSSAASGGVTAGPIPGSAGRVTVTGSGAVAAGTPATVTGSPALISASASGGVSSAAPGPSGVIEVAGSGGVSAPVTGSAGRVSVAASGSIPATLAAQAGQLHVSAITGTVVGSSVISAAAAQVSASGSGSVVAASAGNVPAPAATVRVTGSGSVSATSIIHASGCGHVYVAGIPGQQTLSASPSSVPGRIQVTGAHAGASVTVPGAVAQTAISGTTTASVRGTTWITVTATPPVARATAPAGTLLSSIRMPSGRVSVIMPAGFAHGNANAAIAGVPGAIAPRAIGGTNSSSISGPHGSVSARAPAGGFSCSSAVSASTGHVSVGAAPGLAGPSPSAPAVLISVSAPGGSVRAQRAIQFKVSPPEGRWHPVRPPGRWQAKISPLMRQPQITPPDG